MCVRSHGPDAEGLQPLLSGRGLESGHHLGWYPAAVCHLDALRLGPLADLGGASPSARAHAPPGKAPRTASGPAGRPHVARQLIPQCLGVLGIQVDLVLGAVQPEPDSAFSLAAVEVIDEQGLYLMGHDCCSVPGVSPMHQRRQPDTAGVEPHRRAVMRTVRPQVKDGSPTSLCSRTGASRSWTQVIRHAGGPAPGTPVAVIAVTSPPPDPPGHRQSAASQSASRSITFWRICGDGGISGLGGCKIGSRPGPVQAGNAGSRSP